MQEGRARTHARRAHASPPGAPWGAQCGVRCSTNLRLGRRGDVLGEPFQELEEAPQVCKLLRRTRTACVLVAVDVEELVGGHALLDCDGFQLRNATVTPRNCP